VKIARFLAWTLALVPWAMVLMLGYWMIEPVPVRVQFVSPFFLSQPAGSREEAGRYYVTEAYGDQVLYRYIEYCVDRPFNAEIHRAWVNDSMVWGMPDLPTSLSRDVGCDRRSIAVHVPTSNPTRKFNFVQRLHVQVNPLRHTEIDYPPSPLTILAK